MILRQDNTDVHVLKSDENLTKLPVIGTSWYERNTSYWLRRVCYSLLMAIFVAIETLILAAIWTQLSGRAGRIVFIAIEGGLTLVTGIVVWMKSEETRVKYRKPLATKEAERTRRTGVIVGLMAGAGSIIGGVFIVLGSLLTYGLALTLLVRSFLPYLDGEYQARAALPGDRPAE